MPTTRPFWKDNWSRLVGVERKNLNVNPYKCSCLPSSNSVNMELYGDKNMKSSKKDLSSDVDVPPQNFSYASNFPPQYEQTAQPHTYPHSQGPYTPQMEGSPYPTPNPQSQTLYIQNPQAVIVQKKPPVEYISSYMSWSVFNTMCCCWILGAVAWYCSYKVRSLKNQGEVEEAQKKSSQACCINVASTIIGLILIAVVIAIEVTSGAFDY